VTSAAPPDPPAPDAPPPARRRWQNAFIALFLGYQLLAPLDYYLGEQGYDERFSWRMFSNVRMHECTLSLSDSVESGGVVSDREIDAKRELHVAWFNILNRYRPAVVEKFLSSRCEKPGVTKAAAVRRCTDTDGTALPVQRAEYDCKSGALREESPAP